MEAEAPTSLRIEFRRPGLLPGEPVRSVLLAASLFLLVLAASVELLPGFALAVHLRVVGALFGLGVVVALLLRLKTPPPIELDASELRAPRFSFWRRPTRVAIENVFDAHLAEGGAVGVLGIAGRLPLRFRGSRLRGGVDDASRLVGAVRSALAALSDGAGRVHALDARERVAASARAVPWATYACLAALLGVYVVQVAQGVVAADPLRLVQYGANSPVLVARGEWYRLVTANLLHAGLGHLYPNALLLLLVAPRLELVLGPARTAIALVCAAIGGALVSNAVTGSTLSVGSSTCVTGVLGGLLYLNLARRDELPAGLRAPAWLMIAAGAAQLAFERAAPNVDHGAHIGGFAAGWLSTAAVVGRVPLVGLREEGGPALRIGLGVALACVVGSVAWGAVRIGSPDAESRALIGEDLLTRPDVAPEIVNNVSWEWADAPDTPPRRIALARTSMERVVRHYPASHAFWDTYALVAWRDGLLDDAIIAQWNAKVLLDNPIYGQRLAAYEAERLDASGALRLGPSSAFAPGLRVTRPRAGEAGDKILELRLPARLPNGVVLHALLYREGALYGHLELWLGPTASTVYRFTDPTSEAPLDAGVAFRIALVDTRPKGLPAGSRSLQIWTFQADGTPI